MMSTARHPRDPNKAIPRSTKWTTKTATEKGQTSKVTLRRLTWRGTSLQGRPALTLETNGNAADDALGRAHHEQFVVDGGVREVVAEQAPHRDQHLPLRAGEIQKRQRLIHLHVKPRAQPGRAGVGVGQL